MERLGWIGNFRAAVEGLPRDRRGVVFTDSDVYELMEAAAWESGRSGSSDADRRVVELAETIAPVQEADGYLNTVFGRPGQPGRYSDLEWGPELYCHGDMLQAAVARARIGHRDLFVDVATRAADHISRVFDDGSLERVGGHPEVYANPLHQRVPGSIPHPGMVSNRAASSIREPWFAVSCCPTNVARTFASLAGYIATIDSYGLQLHQYTSCRISTTLDDGRSIGIRIDTDYPIDDRVSIEVVETDVAPWTLTLRVAAWAEDAWITDRGSRRRSDLAPRPSKGRSRWETGSSSPFR